MTVSQSTAEKPKRTHPAETQVIESATIRFAGDSGDGMQLAGTQFTNASAIMGNDISTLPDFPAEIRAPAGTLAGVSGFQVHFSSSEIYTPGDQLDALVAMNPAALKTNIKDLQKGGILIVNSDAFATSDLHKAGYKVNPLEDGSLKEYKRLPGADQQAQPRGGRRGEAEPARSRPLQEFLRPGPGLLALRAAARADACAGSARNSPRIRPFWRPTRAA